MVAKKAEKVGERQRTLSSMAGSGLPESPGFRRWVEAELLRQYGTGNPVVATWNGGFRFRGPDGKIYQQATARKGDAHEFVGPFVEVPADALPSGLPPVTPETLRSWIEAEVRRAFKDPASVHVTLVAPDHFEFVLAGRTYRQAIELVDGGVSFEDFAEEVA